MQRKRFVSTLVGLGIILLASFVDIALAGTRFNSSYTCSDASRVCVSSGIREVDGFEVHRDCWDWAYVKTCNYPSKNNCRLYSHCYAAGDKGCLLQDSLGNCVNMQREFSCKSWDVVNLENQTSRMGFEEKPGKDGLVCKGVPCIDGHCVDKSYETNGKMMDSLSKLYATSNMNPDKDGNFNLFEGATSGCSKKALGYSNCCRIGKVGWGKNIGAKCTKDERTLMEQRSKNLCVYVGSEKKKQAGVHILTKHRYCCFGNILDKVIQVEARKQPSIRNNFSGDNGFGTGKAPDCRGLTLEEIQKVDWNKVDFTEFIEELKVKFAGSYKAPTADDLKNTIEGSLSSINGFDSDLDVAGSVDSENFDPLNPSNLGGINSNIKDDSWEAEEERRIVAEQREKKRLAKLEQERLEAERQERIAREDREREIRLAQEQRRNHLENLKRKKELELEEIKPKLENENELSSLHLASSSVINVHPSFWTKHKKLYKDSMLRASFLKSTKTRLEKELKEIEEEFSNILLPDQLKQKREAKQDELNIAKVGFEKVRTEFDHNDYGNSSLKYIYYQREINRLEQDLREEAY